MGVGDFNAGLAGVVDGGEHGAVGRTPAQDEQVAGFGAVHLQLGDEVGDPLNLLGAQVGHALVVLRRIGDIAADVGLLQAADAVLESRLPGWDEHAGERLRIAHVGSEVFRRNVFEPAVRHLDRVELVQIGNGPRLRRVGQIGVGQQHHRRHELEGQPHRLEHHVEAVARRLGGEHAERRLAVAAEHDLEQVGLLGLGRHAGRGAGALHIEHDQRQLGHHGQVDRLALERDAGARRAGHAESAAVGRADRGADR